MLKRCKEYYFSATVIYWALAIIAHCGVLCGLALRELTALHVQCKINEEENEIRPTQRYK